MDGRKETILMRMGLNGKKNIAKVLIEAGADVNTVGNFGMTALMTAARYLNIGMIEALIEAKADVNMVDKLNRTALMWAAMWARAEGGSNVSETNVTDAVKALIKAGANINKLNDSGETALMMAVFKFHIEAVKVLIDAGADVNIITKNGYTALKQARGDPKLSDLLKKAGAKY
jgi:hypothetical protein